MFLGFTTRSRDQARAFTNSQGITWPNAYGVEGLNRAAPVIYVVGADGHIAWSDDRSRYRHEIDNLQADVGTVIERELRRGAHPERAPVDKANGQRAAMPLHGG